MIEFNDAYSNIQRMTEIISAKIKLVRALANFQIDAGDPTSFTNLENQRTQILNSVRELEEQFSKLLIIVGKFVEGSGSNKNTDPEISSNQELIAQFIKSVVPESMQSVWHPDSFTGSLLVFFENGKIESSSLVKKKHELRFAAVADEETENDLAAVEFARNNRGIVEPIESFTVLKSPANSGANIYFHLPGPSELTIDIFNEKKQLVRKIKKTYSEPGDYTVEWDGSDNNNEPLPRSLYYCQLQTGNTGSELIEIDLGNS